MIFFFTFLHSTLFLDERVSTKTTKYRILFSFSIIYRNVANCETMRNTQTATKMAKTMPTVIIVVRSSYVKKKKSESREDRVYAHYFWLLLYSGCAI